jgi:ABC-type glycerol-3-phosphate transport system substrate-binding protein
MKKLAFVFGAALFLTASCSKDYSCKCTTTDGGTQVGSTTSTITGKKKDAEKKQKKEELAKRKEETTEIKKLTFTDVVREIRSLKDEISEMKKDIKQVLSFMTSIYDFETKE